MRMRHKSVLRFGVRGHKLSRRRYTLAWVGPKINALKATQGAGSKQETIKAPEKPVLLIRLFRDIFKNA